jgi:phosphatidylserine synthase
LTGSPNPAATVHLPFFVTAPGETDVLFNVTVVFVVAIVILAGVIFLTIHSLPERMAHKSKKIQLDIVAVLCLLALFTHDHAFWFAALLLAFLDIPDFLTPFTRIATSVETIAGQESDVGSTDQFDPEAPEDLIAHQQRQDNKGPAHA